MTTDDAAEALWLDNAIRDRIERLAATLSERGQTLATAECTLGGLLGHLCTNVPGASAWYLGGVTVYAADAKAALLGVEAAELGPEGTVSAQAARVLARALYDRLGATWSLAETGITGPRGTRRSSKEPGIAFLAVRGPDGNNEREVATGLDKRLANKRAFLLAALELLDQSISK